MSLATVIPPHLSIDGRIEAAGDLTIEGRVDGDLEVDGTLVIAAGAVCRANVRARAAEISGELIGNLVCTDRITVGATGRVVGDLRAPDISVAAGAEIDGRVDLLPPAPDQAAVRRVPVATRGPAPRAPAPPPRPLSSSEYPSDEPATERGVPAPPRPRGRTRVTPRDG